MFESFQECLDAYKEDLKSYIIWFDKKKKEYGEIYKVEPNEVMTMEMFDSADYGKLEHWNESLSGMQEVLGISEEEDEKIMEEVKEDIKKDLKPA